MSKLQELFNRIQKSKKEQKDLKLIYSDALKNNQGLQRIVEQIKSLKTEKKKIEDSVKEDFQSEFNKLDTLRLDIENDQMLLSDAAMTRMMAGKTAEVEDEKGNKFEPIFKVNFKKS